jgi:hypothetical protein
MVEGGFDVVQPGDRRLIAQVRWANVARVDTYKLDLITTDCVCLRFELLDGSNAVQVSEEWVGFERMRAAMALAFPSVPADWYSAAVKPAFERNQRALYVSNKLPEKLVV